MDAQIRSHDRNKAKCTACERRIKRLEDFQMHLLLKVPVCDGCGKLYKKEFEEQLIGDRGSDEVCRWCCYGGVLAECSSRIHDRKTGRHRNCPYAFCFECCHRNCPEDELIGGWVCYVCDGSKLRKIRDDCVRVYSLKVPNKKGLRQGRTLYNQISQNAETSR